MTPQQRFRAKKRELGECAWCPEPAHVGQSLCAKHREERRIRHAEFYRANREAVRVQRLALRYGLSAKEVLDLEERHRGLCGLCGRPETVRGSHGKVKALAVDHNHETGKVRGLLCNNCNRAIGLLDDDPDLLTRAASWVLNDGLVG